MHIVEHLGHGFAVDNLVDFVVVGEHVDVHGIGVTKQIVQVTQNLLICTHKKHSEIVVLALAQIVNRQRMRETLL